MCGIIVPEADFWQVPPVVVLAGPRDSWAGTESERQMPEEDTVIDKARYLAIGVTSEAAGLAWRSTWRLARAAGAMGKAGLSVVKPVTDSDLFKPLRTTFDAVAIRQQERLEEMVKVGRQEEGRVWRFALTVVDIPLDEIITYLDGNAAVRTLIRHAVEEILPELNDHPAVQALIRQQAGQYLTFLLSEPDQVQALIRSQAGDYLAYLQENPELVQDLVRTQVSLFLDYLLGSPDQVQALIRSQAGEYLAYLESNPDEVNALVQQVAGNYLTYLQDHPEELDPFVQAQTQRILDHLSENPEQVQSLVQGQSLTMASQMRDEVRSGTVTADTAVEMIVRSLFKRAPRTELPEPPPSVQARADTPRLIKPNQPKGPANHE